MAKKTRNGEMKTTDYRHTGEKRTNNPPARIAAEGSVPTAPKVRYRYSPHLPPELRFDPVGQADKLPALIDAAGRRMLTPAEQKVLAEALRQHQPWLEWAGKQEQHERGFFEVDPVALHIHERISTQAMLRALAREDIQRDLFADPQQPYSEAVQFYKHPVDWANRLILGDSLQVMTSLARREDLAGKVQMIYMDPPYGIRFGSNFQPEIGRRDVSEQSRDLARESEVVRAYRDTWSLGVHSYLAYLQQRLVACRDLLADSGHMFVQIGEDNVHAVRTLVEELFGKSNYVLTILLKKKAGQKSGTMDPINDYLLWVTKDRPSANRKYRQIYTEARFDSEYTAMFNLVESPSLGVISLSQLADRDGVDYRTRPELLASNHPDAVLLTSSDATIGGVRKNQSHLFNWSGRRFDPGLSRGNCWKHTAVGDGGAASGMDRLAGAERLLVGANQVRLKRYARDFGAAEITNWWDEFGGAMDRVYAVQTNSGVIARCLLMTTDPGDLVLDPTGGSGTTAFVAEQWGRRWISVDTSRVAISITRQRLMTSKYQMFRLRDPDAGPSAGLFYRQLRHVTSSVVANCEHLDRVLDRHRSTLTKRLDDLNAALMDVRVDLRHKLEGKLLDKQKRDGKKSIGDADRRRWMLPPAHRDKSVKWTVDANYAGWYEWEVPFDTDPDWPKRLQEALVAYRAAWRAKMDEVNACIAANADMEELVDKPEVTNGVVRVSGPFTVEGVRPEELSLGEEGLFDPTPNEFEAETTESDAANRNVQSYLSQIVQHLKTDGLTFLDNKHKKFARLEPLFEDASASLIHAEGAWDDAKDTSNTVGVTFGPQHGPVTALQVEEAIRAASRYADLVVAGFSFDAEVWPIVDQQNHPKLRIHIAQIRPDLNEAMNGLLKDTPNSQLFTVFGQPEIDVKETKDGWVCTLKGVDIYNPIENTVRSAGAEKVAAWFLDSDFDGRCFCITQAFFPDQNAWEKIAKSLGSSADPEAFAALKGTTSLPFSAGKYSRIAVKVIDPRGNEVMAIRKLS